MELEFTVYYLPPDPFSYVVSTRFLHLHAEYEGPCRLLDENFYYQKIVQS